MACFCGGWLLGLRLPSSDPVEKELKRLHAGNLAERALAARALGLLRDTRAVDALIVALDDPAEATAMNAASSLGLLGDQRAEEPLRRKLEAPGQELRRAAGEALERLGTKKRR